MCSSVGRGDSCARVSVFFFQNTCIPAAISLFFTLSVCMFGRKGGGGGGQLRDGRALNYSNEPSLDLAA